MAIKMSEPSEVHNPHEQGFLHDRMVNMVKMFALDLPALGLQMRVDGRDAIAQTLVGGNKRMSAS